MLLMRIGCETGEWDWRRIGRGLSNEDLADWATFFRLQAKESDRAELDTDAVRARLQAEKRLG